MQTQNTDRRYWEPIKALFTHACTRIIINLSPLVSLSRPKVSENITKSYSLEQTRL